MVEALELLVACIEVGHARICGSSEANGGRGLEAGVVEVVKALDAAAARGDTCLLHRLGVSLGP